MFSFPKCSSLYISVNFDIIDVGVASLLSKSIQQNAGQTAFGTEKTEIGVARGWRGEGYAFPLTARILYLRLRCKTLYINRNGFRPA